eukprot:m.132484 g.132484  ORF g.132484 m.132484 type:complete len:134 (+) comp9489_c0_seq4:1448-1849(+)
MNRNYKFTAPRQPSQQYARIVPRVVAPAAGASPADTAAVPISPVAPSSVGTRHAFTPQVTNFLKTWLHDRMLQNPQGGIPYVSEEEKNEIADQTGLTVRQITQWFQNRRKDYSNAVRSHVNYLETLVSSTITD